MDIEQSFQDDLRLPPNQIQDAKMVVCNGARGVVEAKMMLQMLGLLLDTEPCQSPRSHGPVVHPSSRPVVVTASIPVQVIE